LENSSYRVFVKRRQKKFKNKILEDREMTKRIYLFVGLVVVLALILAACQPAATPAPEEPAVEEPAAEATEEVAAEKTKVAILLPGLVTDQSWNQFGYEGLQQAEKECGIEFAYSEEIFQDEQLETFRQYAGAGYDIIIGHGGEYGESLFTVAEEFPDVKFVFQNGTSTNDIPNVTAVKLSYSQGGYLAGVMACNMTESNKIGYVVGEWIGITEEGRASYELGAQTCGKDVEILDVATLNWADSAKAREATLALISEGIDVVAHLLDAADAGVFSAADDEGIYAIGLMSDQRSLGPKSVIGSQLISPSVMTYQVACGKFLDGGVHALSAQDGGVDVALTDLMPEEVQAIVLETLEKMKSGELEVKP